MLGLCRITNFHRVTSICGSVYYAAPVQLAYSRINNANIQKSSLTTYTPSSRRQNYGHGSYKTMVLSMLFGSGMCVYLHKDKQFIRCHHKNSECANSSKWDGMTIKLYQYQTCPFCTKTRCFLLAHGIPFENIEVHPIFKKEMKFSKYKKVPLVTVEKNGEVLELRDSSLIISILSSYIINEGMNITELLKRYPTTTVVGEDGKSKQETLNKHWLISDEADLATVENDARKEEAEWRFWADDYLVHLISPNVYRTYREAYQAFDYHVKQGRFNGTWEGVVAKYLGSIAMWGIAKRLKTKYKLDENVRLDLYKACNKWTEAIGKGRTFMGGSKPNLADVSVFGVLSVMENLDSFHDVLTHTNIKKWYYKTKQAIEDHGGQTLNLRTTT
nr:prostaglandin E synthase 2 isoform X2 [Ciona intestinalis]|eukprot:XP_002128139.1 prostaglandin E synthase 2 isoform X2 [Ciona intestinalis]